MAALTLTATIENEIRESLETKQRLLDDLNVIEQIAEVAELCIAAFRRGNRLLIAGNGGSAADAQHIAAELVSRFYYDRPGLPAIALTTDTSMLTAIGNDYGYEHLFARQIQANGRPGDVFIGISTSGKSKNILNGMVAAQAHGLVTIGLTGSRQSPLDELCDICIHIPSESTPRIQECHILVGHIACARIEASLFPLP